MPIIKLFANLRNIAATKELSVPGSNLREILQELAIQVPALDGVILEDGQVKPHFVININGHATTSLDVSVSEQDTIAIFPPIAGG